VSRIETIATTEVVHVGITSRIHIIAVNTNIAITLCCVRVKIGRPVSGLSPKKDVGTSARKKVNTHTTRNERQRLRFMG
jgi:hypothetical protein